MARHAFLSASASYRWINCPPSAKLCEGMPDETSTYAQEGTDCHELCAYLVEKAMGRDAEDPTGHLSYYSAEMQSCAEEYCSYVMEQYEKARGYCKDPVMFIEQRLDFSRWVEEGFGTGDCVIIADEVLHIIDYKHGLGVLVGSEGNTQMMCYALGALDAFDDIYDIKRIEMTIFQPRRDNVSTWSLSRKDLLDWADMVLAPTARMAYEGKGEFKAGDHCQFCKAKSVCRKRAEHNLELARYDFAMPDTLSEMEIAAILPRIDQLISWGNDLKDYALSQAQSGTHYEGFKVVEGRSNRKYTDEDAVARTVTEAGYDPYEKKILGITAMSSLLGKKRFEELLGSLIYKPPGKPALVPETDPRPAMDTAAEDFKDKTDMEEK